MNFWTKVLNKGARVALDGLHATGVARPLWHGLRRRVYMRRLFADFEDSFRARVYGDRPPTVLAGPFRGMRFLSPPVYGKITARWIGSYEEQLHPVIQTIVATGYRTIIDVGSSEGYYAVGLGRLMPGATIHAFDTDPVARFQLGRLAKINGVGNVVQQHFCSHDDLTRLIGAGDALVIADIEGFEMELLDPTACPALGHADVLVETHSWKGLTDREVAETIRRRFEASHDCAVIPDREREVGAYRGACGGRIDDGTLRVALGEERAVIQQWLWLTRKTRAGQPSPAAEAP